MSAVFKKSLHSIREKAGGGWTKTPFFVLTYSSVYRRSMSKLIQIKYFIVPRFYIFFATTNYLLKVLIF